LDRYEGSSSSPLVLFDGVCNLCHAWVQWIVRHDRRGVFRFAALQSAAAQRSFGDATPLSADSIVLVDERGRHIESEAILRIAHHLGGAWRLLAIARLFPRRLRDAAYRWIARNRYRWFGRQNTCVQPRAELRERFLDADEWPATGATDLPKATRSAASVGFARVLPGFLHRFVLTYFCIYVFPFPIGMLPFTDKLTGAYSGALHRVVAGLANSVFGIHTTWVPSGSGDRTYNYVELLFNLTLALVIAASWTLRARGRPVGSRTAEMVRSYVRYALAAWLFYYGWFKVIPTQMPAPGPDRLLNTIGNTSPMGLLWTLMGSSYPYQIFAGLGEVVAAVLLVWRQTALAGSLVATAVLTNVVMLNFCFDVPVKLFSSHLLAMALFLATPHAMRLAAVLLFNLPAQPVPLRPDPIGPLALRRVAWVAQVALIAIIAIAPAFHAVRAAREYGFLAKRSALHGTWAVDSFERGGLTGRENATSVRWVMFGINDLGGGAIQFANGATRQVGVQVNAGMQTMLIRYGDEQQKYHTDILSYVVREPGILDVQGAFEGATVNATLHRLPADWSLLLGRGFHWISEVPFNR